MLFKCIFPKKKKKVGAEYSIYIQIIWMNWSNFLMNILIMTFV